MKINWGLIGLGKISNIFAEAFQDANNSNLLAIADEVYEELTGEKIGD